MGSTNPALTDSIPLGDHPHIHGEHFLIDKLIATRVGSPPYTWGAHLLNPMIKLSQRITPIYMGSTMLSNRSVLAHRDHPHIHGEHSQVLIKKPSIKGSPPYTWGARGQMACKRLLTRITPIYMGSTKLLIENTW